MASDPSDVAPVAGESDPLDLRPRHAAAVVDAPLRAGTSDGSAWTRFLALLSSCADARRARRLCHRGKPGRRYLSLQNVPGTVLAAGRQFRHVWAGPDR